jgi:hypothetical protein
LPERDKVKLSIDRTNWKFGQTDINIFMLGVVYHGVAFPLLFSMLDKRGNSNSGERIALIERFIRRARTLFKYGLDYLANCLLNALKPMEINIVQFLSCT